PTLILVAAISLSVLAAYSHFSNIKLVGFLHVIQVLAPLGAAFMIARRRRLDGVRTKLILSLIILGSSDLIYYFVMHFFKLSNRHVAVELVTTVPYLIFYFLMISCVYKPAKRMIAKMRTRNLMAFI